MSYREEFIRELQEGVYTRVTGRSLYVSYREEFVAESSTGGCHSHRLYSHSCDGGSKL